MPVIVVPFMQYAHRAKTSPIQEMLQQLLRHYTEIIMNQQMEIQQCKEEICSPRNRIQEACDAEEMLIIENQKLDIELQNISPEIVEKYLTKIHIINVLPYKNGKSNVVEAEILKGGISSQMGYYDGEVTAILKAQFTDKEDYIGISDIILVEKNEEEKTMVYFTLKTNETANLVVPQMAFVSCFE